MSELSINLDYVNRRISASLIYLGEQTGLGTPLTARVFDENGVIIQDISLAKWTGQSFNTLYRGSEPFGLRMQAGGYDTSVYRTDLSGLYYSDWITHWGMAGSFASESGAVVVLTSGHIVSGRALDKRDDIYYNTPVLVTRGDAVFHARISTVATENVLTLTSDKLLASYTGYRLDNCIMQVISGSNSGATFAVTDHTLGSSNVTVDRSCYGLSGQIVKVMPYRLINDYSGWSRYTPNYFTRGNGGIQARFSLTENLPAKIGSLSYTTGQNIGFNGGFQHPLDTPDDLYDTIATSSQVTVGPDTYLRDIQPGDLIFYNPASNPSAINSGVVVVVTVDTGNFNTLVAYWPTGTAYTGSPITIYRGNHFELQTFPNFDSKYLMSVSVNTGVSLSSKVFETPSAELELTANEFESTFSLVTPTAHFHFGPVKLSNGQYLDDKLTMTGGVPPYLRFSGLVTNGDIASPTVLINGTMFSTQSTGIGQNFGGSYYKDGVFTTTASSSFNASETLYCKTEINYGSARIGRVFTIPVIPAI